MMRRLDQAHAAHLADDEVLHLLGIIEQTDDRDRAGAVRAALRPRLARLRPPRPLGFARLLFEPFNAIIVERADWRPGAPFRIPRSAIPPISRAVRRALSPAELRAVDAALAHRTRADVEVIATLGPVLWERAASTLAGPTGTLPGWEISGLSLADCMAIRRGCVTLWLHVVGQPGPHTLSEVAGRFARA